MLKALLLIALLAQVEPEIVSSGGKLSVLSVTNAPPDTTIIWVLPNELDDPNYSQVENSKVYVAFPETAATYNFTSLLVQVTDGKVTYKKLKYAYTQSGPAPPGPQPGPNPSPSPIAKTAHIIAIYESESKTKAQTDLLTQLAKLGYASLREVDPDDRVSGTNVKIVTKYHYDLVTNAAGLSYPVIIVASPTGDVIKTLPLTAESVAQLR